MVRITFKTLRTTGMVKRANAVRGDGVVSNLRRNCGAVSFFIFILFISPKHNMWDDIHTYSTTSNIWDITQTSRHRISRRDVRVFGPRITKKKQITVGLPWTNQWHNFKFCLRGQYYLSVRVTKKKTYSHYF